MSALEICLLTLGGCLAGSLIPVLNSEVFVLGLAAVAPPGLATAIVLCAASGQMAGKIVWYLGGRGSIRITKAKDDPRVASTLARLETHRRSGSWLLLASASTGLPPLLALSVACGIADFGLRRFVALGLVGRVLRFGAVVQLPHLFSLVVP